MAGKYDALLEEPPSKYDVLLDDEPPVVVPAQEAPGAVAANLFGSAEVREPSILSNAVQAAIEVAKDFIPRTTEQVAGMLTPIVGLPRELGQTYNMVKDVALGEKTISQSAAENIPESQALVAAEASPPYSKERFKAGFSLGAQAVMAGSLAKGLTPKASAKLATIPDETIPPATEIKPTVQEFVPPEGEIMRKSAERATTAESIPPPVQETIKTAPESFYEPQRMRAVEQEVNAMADIDLGAVPKESNLYTAAKLEQSRRLFEKGNNEAGYNVFVELEKEGTRLGQLINQFKFLVSSKPETVVAVINKGLEKAGKDLLTPEQSTRAIETAKAGKTADTALDNATSEWLKNPTPENAVKAEGALDAANASALELQRFTSRFTPRSTSQVLKSVLQGNLLTPISEVANLVGNVSFVPFRAASRAAATAIDVIDSFIRKKPRETTISPAKGTVEAIKGIGRGIKQIPGILLKGTGDVIKGEARAGLHPMRAWVNQFAKNPEMPTVKGKITLHDRVNLAIEGTFGVPAEAMLRGIGAGDVPFKEAARARIITNEAKLQNVPQGQLRMAQKFPELFFDRATVERIGGETSKAIFQGESSTLNHITKWIKGGGDMFDLAIATVAPYKLTPWNIVGEILSYNPLVAFGRTTYEAARGGSLAAKNNAGKFAVGSMLTAGSWWLYKKGLVAPSMDQRDETQKARLLAEEVLPPNHLNVTGLTRALGGGDPAFQAGDKTVNIFRAGGLAGATMYMTANIGRDFERSPDVGRDEVLQALVTQSTIEQARFGLNQSFLQGVGGLLTAVKDGNADSYIQSYANTVASIPLPNSLTTLSRATREFKTEIRDDSFVKRAENVIKNRLGLAGTDDYMVLKRGLWGEPLRETPEGRNALIYQFFDVTKGKQVTDDPVALELYRVWRTTGNTKVIPSLPENSVTVAGKTYNLTQEQRSRYAELVGTERRKIAESLVVNPNWHALPNEQKIKILDSAYTRGQDIGKALLWREVQGDLEEKAKRAGFAAQ